MFKFMVDDPKAGKLYLADATGAGTKDAEKALACELVVDVIKCGGKGFPDYPKGGDMLQLATTGNSKGWSIDAKDNILWSANAKMKFSVGINGASNLWAETCPHHWTEHGTAKAVWI